VRGKGGITIEPLILITTIKEDKLEDFKHCSEEMARIVEENYGEPGDALVEQMKPASEPEFPVIVKSFFGGFNRLVASAASGPASSDRTGVPRARMLVAFALSPTPIHPTS